MEFARSQDLAPRAYVVVPVRTNAVTLTWSYYSGGLNLNGALPVSDTSGKYSIPVFTLSHSLNFFGRSSNIAVSLPYGIGNFSAIVQGTPQSAYRSGLVDSSARFSVNLKGGPAMTLPDYLKWKQKTIIGASLKVIFPTGQYDPEKVVNWGINRWAFKPEVGLSRRWGHWLLDAYGGVWFYTDNPRLYNVPIPKEQSKAPIGSFEGHFSHDFDKFRCWVSLDGNFWFGGVTSIEGIENPDTRQTSSRLGATVSLPVTKHQSIKAAFSSGTYIRFGGNYKNLQVAWQYSWIQAGKH